MNEKGFTGSKRAPDAEFDIQREKEYCMSGGQNFLGSAFLKRVREARDTHELGILPTMAELKKMGVLQKGSFTLERRFNSIALFGRSLLKSFPVNRANIFQEYQALTKFLFDVFEDEKTFLMAADHFDYDKTFRYFQGSPDLELTQIKKLSDRKKYVRKELSETYARQIMEFEDENSVFTFELWEKIFSAHKKHFDEASESLSVLMHEMVPVCKDALVLAAEKEIPLSKEEILRRLDNINYEIYDEYLAQINQVSGDYSPNSHTIRIAAHTVTHDSETSESSRIYLKRVLIHEMNHALSGHTLIKGSLHDDEEPDSIQEMFPPEIEHLRHGLCIDLYTPRDLFLNEDEDVAAKHFGTKRYRRFSWLNEAVTSQLEDVFIFDPQNKSYLMTQKIVDLLFPESDTEMRSAIRDAYYENYVPGVGIPKWKKFYALAEERLGKGVLRSIDRLFQEEFKKLKEEEIERAAHKIFGKISRGRDGKIILAS